MQSIEDKLIADVCRHGEGWVFTPKEFSAYGDARVVGMALTRLCRKNVIRRLERGLYDYPCQHKKLGLLSPSIEAVAKALAGSEALRLLPSGGYAANLLGLSEQMPMKTVFLTDGPSRKVKLNDREIVLKHTTPRNMATAGKISGLVIQALRHLGINHMDDSVMAKLRKRLNKQEKAQLLKDLRYAPAWVAAVMRQITQLGDE